MNSYERRCHLLMRAYPPRYRQAHADVFIGTLLDLAEPGRSRPSARDSFDVIRGGIALRLRERPPLVRWALYRLFGVRVPYAHRWWVRDDLVGRFFLARQLSAWLVLFSPMLLLISRTGPLVGDWVIGGLLACLFAYLGRRSMRRYQLAKHEFDIDGTTIR